MSIKFSVGYNHDPELLNVLSRYKKNIDTLYFPIPIEYEGSGRMIPQPENYTAEIRELINFCRSVKIESRLLLNASCMNIDKSDKTLFKKTIGYIRDLEKIGLSGVTVSNPLYIREIRQQTKSLTIESSVNCYVKSVEQALYLKQLGVDIITIDRDINRNIELIKKIKKTVGLKIKILLNEGCLRNCPFRQAHYNMLAHGYKMGEEDMSDQIFDGQWGIVLFSHVPEKVFSIPFIPPEALFHYENVVDYFKISTRIFATPRIETVLGSYINREYSGNLALLLDSPCTSRFYSYIDYNWLKKKNFFKKMLKCDGHCSGCHYCKRLFDEAVISDRYFLDDSDPARLQEKEKAVRIYTRLLNETGQTGNTPLLLKLADTYLFLRNYEKAIETAKCAIDSGIPMEQLQWLLGTCYSKIGEYELALSALHIAETENPDYPQVNYLLALCYQNLGQNTESAAELAMGDQKTSRLLQI